MTITAEELIEAPRERVWQLVTNPDVWEDMISGIVSIEVIDRPAQGVVGLKWREKRILFGKEATETMWVTAAETNRWYETRAENHGAVYTTRISLDDVDAKTRLRMEFSSRATTFVSKLMSLMAFMFNGALRKMMQQDLRDIRARAEQG